MKRLKSLSILLLVWVMTACVVWEPVVYDELEQEAVSSAINSFKTEPRLDSFFETALAYAVFPGTYRAGAGFGAAYGQGWLFENSEVVGRAMLTELFVGANFGAQGYRKIIFFAEEWPLDQFKRGRFEFTGQANATIATVGKNKTPSYNPGVAIFIQVKGGLIVEASVGAQRYDFFPIPEGHAFVAD
ncbi:MAG: hypothetical protein ABJK25_11485 [Halieaceae bacterium]